MTRKLLPTSILAASAGALMLVVAACGTIATAPEVQLGTTSTTSAVQTGTNAAAGPTAPATTADQSAAAPADATASNANPVWATAADSPSVAAAGASPASSGATTQAASAGAVSIALNSSNATAQYQTQEQLAGHNLPNMAVGKTADVSGSIVLANGQLDATASKITVDLSTLASDESMRDNFVKNNTLQTSRYPEAVFVPTSVSGLPATLPTSGSATFQLTGDLTVHGVTKPITWTVIATFNGNTISGKATAPFTITEFGMTAPKAGPVLSVQDAGTLELDFSNVALTQAA